MQLSQYLEAQKITDAEFAKRLDVAQSTVLRLKRGDRRPSLELAQRISELTGGKVPPSAFFTVSDPVAVVESAPAKDAAA